MLKWIKAFLLKVCFTERTYIGSIDRKVLSFKTKEATKEVWPAHGVAWQWLWHMEVGFGGCFLYCSWCYKTFFGGILENLDFPLSWNSKNRPFKRKKQYFSIDLLKMALFSHFSAGSDIRTNFFPFLNFWGNLDFLQKKLYNINYWRDQKFK